MKEFMAVVKAEFYNEVSQQIETENIVITNVDTYKEAMELVEKYYGDTLEGAHIALITGPFLRVADRIVDEIMTEEIENE